jgi:hypothetical protein
VRGSLSVDPLPHHLGEGGPAGVGGGVAPPPPPPATLPEGWVEVAGWLKIGAFTDGENPLYEL